VSLAGKKILVTRPLDQSDAITRLLHERGAKAVYFPTIRILPPASWDECDEAIDIYRTYHAVILTSVNAVRQFYGRAVERGLNAGFMQKNTVYVVGSKTAEAVASFGIAASRIPGVTTVAMLSDALCAMPVRGKRFLFPKGSLAGSEIAGALRAQGAQVDEVVVYRTAAYGADEAGNVPAGTAGCADTAEVCAMLRSGAIDAVTFFSPSSVEGFFAAVPRDALGSAVVAAIGPTTADALHTLSLQVHIVAAEPSSEELVAALERYFNQQ